ncbi:MAG: type II secretion system F family protein [Methanobrevibacter sp.]|jgi:flagellar protein FlaJ|nr:type II secretion system F family protein [Candidatus Methanovirga australis]
MKLKEIINGEPMIEKFICLINSFFYELGNLTMSIFNKKNFKLKMNKNLLKKILKNKIFKYEKDDYVFKISNKNNENKSIINMLLQENILNRLNLKLMIPIFLFAILIIFLILNLLLSLEIGLISIIAILLMLFFLSQTPKLRKEKIRIEISKELPYALRQMVTELRSGKGLHDALKSIAISDYEALSPQFSRTLEEIKYGETTENAIINMSKRIDSESLNRVLYQIVGSLKTGGNLSYILNIIAEDISHELRIKLKEYSQKLNGFIMIYTFLAVLAPVIILVMIIASSTIIGDVIPPQVILILYLFFFPMIVIFLGFFMKRLEPK